MDGRVVRRRLSFLYVLLTTVHVAAAAAEDTDWRLAKLSNSIPEYRIVNSFVCKHGVHG